MGRIKGWEGIVTILGLFLLYTVSLTETSITDADWHMAMSELPSIQDLMDAVSDREFNTLADLDDFMKTLEDLADLYFEKAFTAKTRKFKRDLYTSMEVTNALLYSFNFYDPNEFNASSLEGVSGHHFLKAHEQYFWVLSNKWDGWQSILELTQPDYKLKSFARFQLGHSYDNIDKIVAAVHLDLLWMAFGSASSSVVTIVCTSLKTGRWLVTQEITILGMLSAVHMFEASGKVYLVIGERASVSPNIEAGLYVLIDNYFDRRDDIKFRVRGVQDITGFKHGETSYYLVFGLESPEAGFEVYQLDTEMDFISLVQALPDGDAMKVHHFIDKHDEKNYILTISGSSVPKIYRWSNRQLREWQRMKFKGFGACCSVGVLTFDNLENLIFIAQGGKITFYTDDMTGHYFPTFFTDTNCTAIKDMQGMQLESDYIISYICVGIDRSFKLQSRILAFQHVDLAESETTTDDLLHCLDEADELLESRHTDVTLLANLTAIGSLMTLGGAQTWSGFVTFSKGLNVIGTTVFHDKVNIKPTGNIVPIRGTLVQLLSKIKNLESSVQEMATDTEKVLYHSGDQTIVGPITGSTLTSDTMTIDMLQIWKVNGISLTDFDEVFLVNGIDQTIDFSFVMSSLMTDSFVTRGDGYAGTINGIRTDEYMRLSIGEQFVTGDHKYIAITSGDITPREGNNSMYINGIDVKTMVTKGATVTFNDHKRFDDVVIRGHLNTDFMNDVNLTSLSSRVVYTDVEIQQTLAGMYTVASLQVDGNVDALTINGVNLRELDAQVVKTTGNFTLQGPVMYMSSLTVNGDLWASNVNGIIWDYILDLDSPDLIPANYYFTNAAVTDAIRCNNINGLDLSEDVVLVDSVQTISGDVTFLADVKVTSLDGVVMEEGGTVNGIDPSLLHTDVSTLVNVTIDEEVHINAPLLCSGDIFATNINGLALDGIEDQYWRYSTDQTIYVGTNIRQAEFRGPVTGRSINGNQISDYLHASGQQYITGIYTFKGPVHVEGDLEMIMSNTVDGIDVSELDRNAVKLYGDHTVESPITFDGRIRVVGDLVMHGLLNSLNITSDLMRLDRSIPHTGHLVFHNTVVATTITLSGNLIVNTINDLDVESAASQLVLVGQEAVIKGDLQFTGFVDVYSLNAGTVDGVNLNDLAERSLKKSSSVTQVVTGHITVKNVHFNQAPSLGLVNLKDWTTHLTNVVTYDYDGAIQGTKTFLQPLDIKENFDPATINGLSVADLVARILTKSTDQTILGHYTFSNSISAVDVSASIIDGIAMSDLVLTDADAYMSGTVTFTQNVTFLGGLNSTRGILDDCDVLKANERAIWKHENGSMSFQLPVEVGMLLVAGSATASREILGGALNIDIVHFLDTLVLKSSHQEITGQVEFLRDVEIGNLHVGTIDGIDIEELFRLSLLDNTETVIRCNLNFTKPLIVGVLQVTEALSGIGGSQVLVNGINVPDVAARAVLATGGTFFIAGRKIFTRGFNTEHLFISGSLGGINLQDLVPISATGVIVGNVKFTAPINIMGNLMVSGLIDGVDLASVFSNRVTLGENQTLFGSWQFEEIIVEGDLEVEQINDVLVSDLVVKYGMILQEISGHKIITGTLSVQGDVHTSRLNGLDIVQLNSSIVRKDHDAIITGVLTFEHVVRARKSIFVLGTVNGFDLSSLTYNVSPLKKIIDQQFERIDRLRQLLAKIKIANFTQEQRFELAYIEKVGSQEMQQFGHLWFGVNYYNLESFNYIGITSTSGRCVCCSQKTTFYQVNSGGTIDSTLTSEVPGAVFILSHPDLNLQIMLNRRCTEEIPTTVTVDSASDPSVTLFTTTLHLGVVIDAGMFVDDNLAYIVTVTGLDAERNIIHTLLVDLALQRVVIVWAKETNYSASKLDLNLVNGNWFLLIINKMNIRKSFEPYTVPSQLYMWESAVKKFRLTGEYVADHASSGIFLKSQLHGEDFFTLAQVETKDCPLHEANRKFTNILVFKYDKDMENFVEFECLPTCSVVDQASLTIDHTNYLVLLSELGALHVYAYLHPEGFKLFQEIKIKAAYSLVIVEIPGGPFIVVSIRSPPGIVVLRAHVQGIQPFRLLD
ncbi:uncharacterized protein [Cherax quadricarinatus]|uniref:uncharacterized protein isoform X2 n=1 Tax=Cherax quadricarinatus TaxID=27406 RepID=UPI00387E8C40